MQRKQGSTVHLLRVHMVFLLSSFYLLTPTGVRTDGSGSTEKRTQVVLDIISRARELVGEDYPILVKLNVTDGFKNNMHRYT